MPVGQGSGRSRGFTVAEAVVVMAAAGIVGAVVVSAAQSAMQTSEQAGDVHELVEALQHARDIAREKHRTVCVSFCKDAKNLAIVTLKAGEVDCWTDRAVFNSPGDLAAYPERDLVELPKLDAMKIAFDWKDNFIQTNDAVVAFTPDGNVGGVRGDRLAPSGEWPPPPPGVYPTYGAILGLGVGAGSDDGTAAIVRITGAGAVSTKSEAKTYAQFTAMSPTQAMAAW